MRGMLPTAMIVASLALPAGRASAQACLEGKTATGQCVDAGLASGLRQAAIIFAQPKISYTAYPILPSLDAQYRYPNQLIPDPLLPTATLPPLPPNN